MWTSRIDEKTEKQGLREKGERVISGARHLVGQCVACICVRDRQQLVTGKVCTNVCFRTKYKGPVEKTETIKR